MSMWSKEVLMAMDRGLRFTGILQFYRGENVATACHPVNTPTMLAGLANVPFTHAIGRIEEARPLYHPVWQG